MATSTSTSSPLLSALILTLTLFALRSNAKPCTISILDVATVEVYLNVHCLVDGSRDAGATSLKPGESFTATASSTCICDMHLRELDGNFTLYNAKTDVGKCQNGVFKWQVGWDGVYELQGSKPVLRYRWSK